LSALLLSVIPYGLVILSKISKDISMPCNILIVDDSSLTRTVIRRTLPLTGIAFGEIHEAAGGTEALSLLHTVAFDIVLTDLHMPEMGGSELIESMDRAPGLRNIPVIVVSTEGSRPRLQQIQRSCVVGYLRKPFTPEQLKSTLCSIMENV